MRLKNKFFGVQRALRWGHVGHPCGARWTAHSRLGKNTQKKRKNFIKQVTIQII